MLLSCEGKFEGKKISVSASGEGNCHPDRIYY